MASTKKFDAEIQKKLDLCLENLSKKLLNKKDNYSYYKDFIAIYDDEELRHKYSNVTHIVVKMLKNGGRENVDILASNLTEIISIAEEEDKTTSIVESLHKLLDHIELEIYRYEFYNSNISNMAEVQNNLEKAREQLKCAYEGIDGAELINEATTALTESNKTMNDAIESAKKIQNETISILGIFSAVVLAFFGGMSLFSSSLDNMHKVSGYKITFVCALIGMMIFDIIVFLVCVISHLSGNPLPLLKNDQRNKRPFYQSIFWTVNVFLVVVIVISFALWMFSYRFPLPLPN